MEVYKGHTCRYLWRFSHSLFQSWTIENCRSFWQFKSNHWVASWVTDLNPLTSTTFERVQVSRSITKSKLLIRSKNSICCDLSPRDLEESPFMFHARKDRLFDVVMLVDITMEETAATTTTFPLFSSTTTPATTFLLFSLHHHHIYFVFSSHFYCFPSTTTRFYKRLPSAFLSSFFSNVLCSEQQSWFSSTVSWLPLLISASFF